MRKICLLLVVALGCGGCEMPDRPPSPPPPKPKIEVELTESSDGAKVVVTFLNHKRNGEYGPQFVQFGTLDDLHDYQIQADFLVRQLEEAEKKMQTHEQGKPKQP